MLENSLSVPLSIEQLEYEVHNCIKCKAGDNSVICFYPVYSFGNPSGKKLIVIGLNPSTSEYKKGFLPDDFSVENRRFAQLKYFKRPYYKYFFGKIEDFFKGEIKTKLGYRRNVWEKVGYLDLVKCPTRIKKNGKKQWSGLDSSQKNGIIDNCKDYLLKQLELYKPELIIPYGTNICEQIGEIFNVYPKKYGITEIKINSHNLKVLFLHQIQGPRHSDSEISKIRARAQNGNYLMKALTISKKLDER